jgi:ParB/RepB/Spo0J family partition protein
MNDTASTTAVEAMAINRIVESPTNPRDTYDPAAHEDLVASVRQHGVQQPIVVRLVADCGAAGTAHEIVFGHRRWRAARDAGLLTIPVIVRELTDAEVAEVQLIENLQRKNLNALEEARGYARLRDIHGLGGDQIAERVGRKRGVVYARLKLLDLSPEAQTALAAGEFGAEVALLIARIGSPAVQLKALAAIRIRTKDTDSWRGRAPSFRELRDLLIDDFTFDLKQAVFPREDAALLPAAGACTHCPKRSGATPDLFGDILVTTKHGPDNQGPDICTDPECFAAKKARHLERQADALRAEGKTVIDGRTARRALIKMDRYKGDKLLHVKGAYVALAMVKDALKKAKGTADAPAVVLLQDPGSGKTIEVIKCSDLTATGIKLPQKKKATDRNDWQAEDKKHKGELARMEAKAAAEDAVRSALLDQVRTAAAKVPRSAFDLQLVARATYAGVLHSCRDRLAKLWGHGSNAKLHGAIGQMSVPDLTRFVLDCALVNDLVSNYLNIEPAETLLAAAKHYGIDAIAVRTQVLAQWEEQLKAAQAKTKTAKATAPETRKAKHA